MQRGVPCGRRCSYWLRDNVLLQDLRIYTPYPFLNQTLRFRDSGPGASFNVVLLSSYSPLLNATEELLGDTLRDYDGFVVDAETLPDFAEAHILAQLDDAIISE